MPFQSILMQKVYFSKQIEKIIDEMDFSKLGENVAIKVHFGEKGCTTYVNPEIVKKVYEGLLNLGKKAALVDCNVLYKGSRTVASEHIRTARENGFDFAPIDILDGEKGDEYVEVSIDNEKLKIGKGIEKYDSMVVISHFKGAFSAGYGGAFKNVGMGLGSRAGKLYMHSFNADLSVDSEKCSGCGICAENCNENAIKINGKAVIDVEKCVNCAMCISFCSENAILWKRAFGEEIQKKIIDYTQGVVKLIPRMVFINVLENITEKCDCYGIEQKPMMEDIGILMSEDIVAVDFASLNMVLEESDGEFKKVSDADQMVQIDYASEKGLGEKEYKIIDLD